jgi:hypothetical protein
MKRVMALTTLLCLVTKPGTALAAGDQVNANIVRWSKGVYGTDKLTPSESKILLSDFRLPPYSNLRTHFS